ncbi:Fe2+/Zn2+ uptake regulation protein, fur/PerR (plasmid) [Halanaeroarchaeum sp. HSR-CO]|uniref:winged helix-turn-helix domain-containing protein n=1 Tax=Halanaeroarchaeum sp. HSR-CO TaxID=2866382 RepID=UPI00217DF9E9|nr:winged helix-turn-helix domain-containing protein [Halanaeroarchaeum sp. HSR-CO]UWG49156.1 Fe2+/Zn2+ uptake regulation protein, fur/PerR [Halanaeroarchaeum sp. HSR-CO]
MAHNTTHRNQHDTTDAIDSTIDNHRQRLNVVTQETRFVLIQNILSHPQQLPTLKELDYVNPSKSKSTIREHLEVLIEHGIVEERTLSKDKRKRDLPWRFYGLTDVGRDLLEEIGLLGAEGTLQDMYVMLETTDEIEKYVQAPRPGDEGEDNELIGSDALAAYIQDKKASAHSVADQVSVATALYENRIGPEHEGLTRNEIAERLAFEYSSRTVLNHLVDIDLLEKFQPPGPSTYVISERRDQIINGEVEETVEEEIERLIDHMVTHMDDRIVPMDDGQPGDRVVLADGVGRTIRSILSEEFDISSERVESYLREEDRLEKLNQAVDAIEKSEDIDKGDDYGRIIFRNPAYRYRLTEFGMSLAEDGVSSGD